MRLSSTKFGSDWLSNFDDPDERKVAANLIDAVLLVNRDSLVRELRTLVQTILDQRKPIALFAERPVEKDDGKILPLFPGTETGTARGQGAPPIIVDPRNQEVGSEGPIANLITEQARYFRGDVLSHPGPDEMRSKRIQSIVIVTDVIGSGKRIFEMLEAFRGVATLRSWRSYGLLSFHVVAYSATEQGLRTVRSSRLAPKISIFTACPTLWNTFSGVCLSEIVSLCKRYPKKHRDPTGYREGGALIAFAHGAPNNAPPIMHSTKGGWIPPFLNRSTANAEGAFPVSSKETMAHRADNLLPIRNSSKYLTSPHGKRWISTLLVLSAIENGKCSTHAVSARSWLPKSTVDDILSLAQAAQWVTKHNALTSLGRKELKRLRRRRQRKPVLFKGSAEMYYPTQLRAR